MKDGSRIDASRLAADVNAELVDLYRGWDLLERSEHASSIIDFDLAPATAVSPARSRSAVLSRLQALAERVDGARGDQHELARARIVASIAYLRALLGEAIDFRTYIRDTLALPVDAVGEDRITRQREQVSKLLWDGFRVRFARQDLHVFQTQFLRGDAKFLPRQFDFFRTKWLPPLLERIDVDLTRYHIDVSFDSQDAYWKNWISGNLAQHQIELKINLHPRHIWYQGFAETLVIHEFCGHAVQMASWHQRLERAQLRDFEGILTVHFPDQFLLEGLAEALAHVLPEAHVKLEKTSLALRELHRYTLLVMHNMHIRANEDGPQAARAYAAVRLPFTPEKILDREIRDRTGNPLFRCYQYVYGVALEAFLSAFEELGHERGWQLLSAAYLRPMTRDQFNRLRARFAAGAARA